MASTATETPTATPYRFAELHVVRAERLGPTMLRVTFGGQQLAELTSGGRDQRLKLFLPHPHQDTPIVPTEAGEQWFTQWRAMDPDVRGIMRTYTVREQRRDPDEMDVDFALHGDQGPASRWAANARPGDRVTILGPAVADNAGVDFRPPEDTEWTLILADETALPAVAGILEWLPATTRARVWIEVPHPEDQQDIATPADADVTWLFRGDASHFGGGRLLDAVRAAELPTGAPYAWIAGEAGTVRALRRHLVNERGFDRRAVTFTGYWREGATEEQLVAEAVAGADPHRAE
ncbi:NADPH-dependent ferric siderophore reductase [Lipingzhangella halophila]|uniref:NADPH-dependent ferric siderophore reductase n=1 Tax=Lipingzhangella halophila TaxID=1783352 RepID=A0A7W7RED4_9ACTN|nr:siderophore-interacting protein [Lipingzhangella halophila]MBB4930430.1 NADPH-dependent ferric siderophore reductase [Lipingzhangella halophila]